MRPYQSVTFYYRSDLLWLLTLFPKRVRSTLDTRYTQSGEILDYEMTRYGDVTLTTRDEKDQKVNMELGEFYRLLLLVRDVQTERDNDSPDSVMKEQDVTSEMGAEGGVMGPPKELEFVFSAFSRAIPGAPVEQAYERICEDLTESQVEAWNDERTPFWNNQLHCQSEYICEAQERSSNAWNETMMVVSSFKDIPRFVWRKPFQKKPFENMYEDWE